MALEVGVFDTFPGLLQSFALGPRSAKMASICWQSLGSSSMSIETTRSICFTASSLRRVSGQFSGRGRHSSTFSTSHNSMNRLIDRHPLQQARSSFFQNKVGNPNKTIIIPVRKTTLMPIQVQRVNFKASRSVTIPFKEGALSANEYLKETERIVKVTFPDSTRIEYLGDRTWRSRLRPLTFISITATPSVEMRVSFEKGALRLYSDTLFLDFTGVPDDFAVADFSFVLDGGMRAVPRSPEITTIRHNCDFTGSVSLGLSTDLPAAFAFIPEILLVRAGDEILDRIIGAMEGALLQGIIRDYNIWSRMKSRTKIAKSKQAVVPLKPSTS